VTRVRAATVADHPAVHALNQAAVPAMNAVGEAFFADMAARAAAFLVAEREATIVGFLLALPPEVPYESANYRWFSSRYDDFVYIDRVAVAAAERGAGVGRALYDALGAAVGERRLCCEVNLQPPNPGSLAFHVRLGFRVVGEQDTEGGAKRVALLASASADR
jgi:uncharacterized protein